MLITDNIYHVLCARKPARIVAIVVDRFCKPPLLSKSNKKTCNITNVPGKTIFRKRGSYIITEAALQRCSWEKVFWKCTANLPQNTHAKVWFEDSCLRYGCSPVNLLHIFRTPFPKNITGGLLLIISSSQKFLNQWFFPNWWSAHLQKRR